MNDKAQELIDRITTYQFAHARACTSGDRIIGCLAVLTSEINFGGGSYPEL